MTDRINHAFENAVAHLDLSPEVRETLHRTFMLGAFAFAHRMQCGEPVENLKREVFVWHARQKPRQESIRAALSQGRKVRVGLTNTCAGGWDGTIA